MSFRAWTARALLAVCLCAPALVLAGSFVVTPVRLDLDAGMTTAMLTLTNAEEQDLTIQVRVMRWTQHEGEDHYEPSRDLIAAPSVFRVTGNAPQVIRIGLRQPARNPLETAYRLYVEEVPRQPEAGNTGVRIALRMGIPVFVAPTGPGNTSLQWQAEQQSGGIVLKAANPGNLHVRLMDFAVLDQTRPLIEREPLIYLLAGQSRQWKIINAPDVTVLQLKAQTDEGELALAVPVSRP